MNLQKALSVLSKSSPFAVKTKGKGDTSLKNFKDYLYVPNEIEEAFKNALQDITPQRPKIIFLCGSSGDGKSEILTRYADEYLNYIDFHLDGTHSYTPHENAIQTLDTCFSKYKANSKSLVVGINIGMLGNYAQEGSSEHADICDAITAFLDDTKHSQSSKEYYFLHFEDYPKFSFDSNNANSTFARSIMERLTHAHSNNPFYTLYQQELSLSPHSYIVSNFTLLAKTEVQDVIIELLLKARLAKDQFLTARTLLDCIYKILCSEGYIFDTLFEGGDNELLAKMTAFDPVLDRSKLIDQFVIQFELNLLSKNFDDFKTDIRELQISDIKESSSYLRLFYLLKKFSIGNSFHQKFYSTNKDKTFKYIETWNLHKDYTEGKVSKSALLPFYKEVLIPSIHKYINRTSPNLGAKEYWLSKLHGFVVAAELDIKLSSTLSPVRKLTSFTAYLTVNKVSLKPIPITSNLLELLYKIQQGYQPSKHDSACVLLLDEIAGQIMTIARKQDKLLFISTESSYSLTDDEGYIEIEEL